MAEIPDAQRFAQMIATLTLDLNSWLDKITEEAVTEFQDVATRNGTMRSIDEIASARVAARLGAALALGRVHRVLGEEAIAMISKAVNDD